MPFQPAPSEPSRPLYCLSTKPGYSSRKASLGSPSYNLSQEPPPPPLHHPSSASKKNSCIPHSSTQTTQSHRYIFKNLQLDSPFGRLLPNSNQLPFSRFALNLTLRVYIRITLTLTGRSIQLIAFLSLHPNSQNLTRNNATAAASPSSTTHSRLLHSARIISHHSLKPERTT